MMELQCTCMTQCTECTTFKCIHLKKTTENYLKFIVYMYFPFVKKIIAQYCYVLGQIDNCTQDGGSTKKTVLIKEHMGFTVTAYILRAQYELLTL